MMQQEVDVMNFLPYHLLGILGGVVVLVLDYFVNRKGGTET
jgi:hypothetical protein